MGSIRFQKHGVVLPSEVKGLMEGKEYAALGWIRTKGELQTNVRESYGICIMER